MSHFSRALPSMVSVAILIGVGACANQEPPTPPSAYAPLTPIPEQYGSTTGPGPTTNAESTDPSAAIPDQSTAPAPVMGATMPQGQDPETLGDPQIAAVVIALHLAAIQQAQLAESRAKTPAVKRLATRILSDRRSMLDKAQVAFSRAQITARENDVSEQLEMGVRRVLATLQAVHGEDFDREYVDWQVDSDGRAFDLIDRLLPRASSAPLRASLLGARSTVYGELREAEAIQKQLSSGRGTP
jgi:putative membrane protein